jgi:hypothetical protein
MSKRKREKMKAKERRHQKSSGSDAAGEVRPPTASVAAADARAASAKAPATAAASTAPKAAAAKAAPTSATAAASVTRAGQSASKKKPPQKKAAAQSKLPQQPETFAHLTSSPEWQRFYREISKAAKIVSRTD